VNPRPQDAAAPLVDFAGLYRTHAQEVRRFALYLSGNASVVDDLVSEAFVRVWTARERVDLTTVRGYLFAIVRNLFLKHVERERRHAPIDEGAVDQRPGPEEQARDQDELRVVLSALAQLPEADRAAVLMRADEGLPYEDIAAVLGISIGAAKVKVHRARLKLAEALQAPEAHRAKERGHERQP